MYPNRMLPVLLALSSGWAGGSQRVTHVLWRDPGCSAALDLYSGAGGRSHAPSPPFRFIKEIRAGTTPKIEIRDSRGRQWVAKFGSESKPDIFASRLAWAAGYIVEPSYFVRQGAVQGAHDLSRAACCIAQDGSFTGARFELRDPRWKLSRRDGWAWTYNPFLGTPQLNGFKVIMMLTSNWDGKDARDYRWGSNTGIFVRQLSDHTEFLYAVTDWGASMGRWGGVLGREKWDCKGYTDQTPRFVRGVRNGIVEWGFSGKHTDDLASGVRVSDVAWLLEYLGRLTDRQIRDALLASGATIPEQECFLRAVRGRIQLLQEVVARAGRLSARNAMETPAAPRGVGRPRPCDSRR